MALNQGFYSNIVTESGNTGLTGSFIESRGQSLGLLGRAPDQNFSGKEYKQAALSGHAFEYESIRDQQENKESLVQTGLLGATIISAGITFFCPPAGITLLTAIGAASGAMEVKSAVTGKDWVSGRELGTSALGDIRSIGSGPWYGSITKFSGTVRLTRVGEVLGQFGLKTGVKGSFQ